MKSIKKIVVIFFALLLQVPITLKAQLDTAHFSNEHINQYIYPPMIDPIGYPSRDINIYDIQGLLLNNLTDNQFNRICSIAQRYEVNEGDSATIHGVAFAHSNNSPYNFDTIKISIWDKYLATELYTQYFLTLVDITTLNEENIVYIILLLNIYPK